MPDNITDQPVTHTSLVALAVGETMDNRWIKKKYKKMNENEIEEK